MKKVTGLFLALTIGLSSGWILRGQEIVRGHREGLLLESEARKTGRLPSLHQDGRGARGLRGAARRSIPLDHDVHLPRVGFSLDAHAHLCLERPRAGGESREGAGRRRLRVQPDQSKRKANSDLAATLRDPVGHEELEILK